MEGRIALSELENTIHVPSVDAADDARERDIERILITEQQIQDKLRELGEQITRDYEGRELLLLGVLKGAFVMMADLSRHIRIPLEVDFMAVASYGAATKTSGVVRILKDLDHDLEGRHVLLIEDIVDSGLTLNYLLKNLRGRRPASLEVCALLKKTGIQRVHLDVKYVGFEIPPDFVGVRSRLRRTLPQPAVRRSAQARGLHRRLRQGHPGTRAAPGASSARWQRSMGSP
jgi:hypoxanthine phosphoribosyltransferase